MLRLGGRLGESIGLLQRGFHCGAADPAPCPCTTLTLAPALLAELRQRYRGCLCLACLAELSAASAPRPVGGLAPSQ